MDFEMFIYNIPFFSIMIAMFAGIITIPVKNGARAWYISVTAECVVLAMSLILTVRLAGAPETITFSMGHYPAPWGNEIRAGFIEALMASLFSFVMLFSIMGGKSDIFGDILPQKRTLYFIAYDELFGAMLALIYTNDIFTAYVFIEISMLAASAIIMAKDSGRSLIATLRYLIMMLLGSGLFLLGVIILYSITGHLLMVNLGDAVQKIAEAGTLIKPLLCVIGLVCIGLTIKSAVYPFHTMLPGAHSVATTASSAVLSGLVLKAYIFLLIKCICRVFSIDLMVRSGFTNVAFFLGCVGTVVCSIKAMRESDLKRMIAYSSSAQIAYIYIGIGIAGYMGIAAALMHIVIHALTKSCMFICAGNLAASSGHDTDIHQNRGAAYANLPAGIGFTACALSMIGLPFFPGFASKLYLVLAAKDNGLILTFTIAALLISMVLNAMYFVPALLAIWSRTDDVMDRGGYRTPKLMAVSVIIAMALIFMLGVGFDGLYELIISALPRF